VGLLLPAIVLAPILIRERALARRSQNAEPWRPTWRDLALATFVFLIVAAPWYAAMTREHGWTYLRWFFVGENLERFATDRFNEPRPVWFYLPIVAGGLMPWSPFLLLGLPHLLRVLRGKQPVDVRSWRLLIWTLAPLLFFSASIGKQPRYILPMLPPLAILLARGIVLARPMHLSPDAAPRRRRVLWVTAVSLVGTAILALGLLLYRARPLLVAVDPDAAWIGSALIVACGIWIVSLAPTRATRLVLPSIAIAAAVTLACLQYSIFSTAGPEPVQRVAALLRQHHRGGEPSGTFRVFVRNLIFYTGVAQRDLLSREQLIDFLHAPQRVFCVLTADDLVEIEQHGETPPLRRLGEVRYLNTAGLKLRALLSPDAQRDLQRVVLVTNR
jgi:4-amino-4-deoxy-L-arabinose transferase-like glycosyltransferase